MHKSVTTAEFNACINALSKTGPISRDKANTIFKTLFGAEKRGDVWRVPMDSFWEYMKAHYGDVLTHRGIDDPAQLIERYTYDCIMGNNYLTGQKALK